MADSRPLDEPEVEASTLRPDEIVPGIEIKVPATGGPEFQQKALPIGETDPVGAACWRLQAATGVALLIEDMKEYRRVVTLSRIGDAARVLVAHRQDFAERETVPAGNLPEDFPVAGMQQLWVMQTTGVTQEIEGHTEPRGSGR